MRIIFVNLHTNGLFLRPFSQILLKGKSVYKLRYILDYEIENVDVLNLVTLEGSTLFPERLKNITRFLGFRKLECNYVLRKNKLKGIKNIYSYREIRQDDILIVYGLGLANQNELIGEISKIKCYKVLDLCHFYGLKRDSQIIKKIHFDAYMFEVPLHKYSAMFKKNYSWLNCNYIERGLAFESRFCNKKDFSKRLSRVLAIGTITTCNDEEFIKTTGSNCYQPLRQNIYNNLDILSDYIDSRISFYLSGKEKKLVEDIKNDKWKIIERLKFKLFAGRQKDYFSFDIVDEFNKYKMFICPEDINGSYGKTTFEGMACGCAMIGINTGMYEDLGMVAGIHYISYDGTINDLINKIDFYRKNENYDKLKKIAYEGEKFVKDNYSEKNAARLWHKRIMEVTEIHESENIYIRC